MNAHPRLAAVVLLGTLATTALAQSGPDEGELTVSFGAARSTEDMRGDRSDKPRWMPTFGVDYRLGRFFAGTGGVGYEVVQGQGYSVLVAGAYNPGRKEGTRNESPRLVGMGRIPGSAELSLGASAEWLDGLVSIQAMHARSLRSEQGGTTSFGATIGVPVWGDSVSGFLGVDAIHADARHAQTYYGVTAAQSARSGNRAFRAKSGVISSGWSLGLNWNIDPQWSATASIGRETLRGSAALSPLTTQKRSSNAALGVAYTF